MVANNLARLLPNIGGASGGARRLYVAKVHSVLLYAAPIWWESQSDRRVVREAVRRQAVKVRLGIVTVPARIKEALRLRAAETFLQRWKTFLENPTLMGKRIITGHGCFGYYLWRIRKERTTRCHYCPEEADTAQHTLEFCPEWENERRVRETMEEDLSLPTIFERSVGEGVEEAKSDKENDKKQDRRRIRSKAKGDNQGTTDRRRPPQRGSKQPLLSNGARAPKQ
ncbi:uncharacterized protein [Temnothorax longispinosus]|uniref:uncharacterized protein n=1 Tax=Temnothorax longispinosus TaxID=300112 RepID=UPI003A9947A6